VAARTMIRVVVLALIVAASAAPAAATAQEGRAGVRVLHLSSGTPRLDVYVDGKRTLAGVSFKTPTRYAPVAPGRHTIAIRSAGAAPGSRPLATAQAAPAADEAYTIVAVGTATELRTVVAKDDFSAPPPGKAKLRAINAAPLSPQLDIALTGGRVLFRNLAFAEATPYVTLDAGRLALEARLAGTDRVIFSSGARPLPAGVILTVAGTGSSAGDVDVVAILDAAGAARIPRGGVATGAGGTAPPEGGGRTWALAVGGLALALGGAVAARRRRLLKEPAKVPASRSPSGRG
jgi:hypothetical protein